MKYKPGTHWTQKPENKARVAAIARKRNRIRYSTKAPKKARIHAQTSATFQHEGTDAQVAFALGSITAWLTNYARSIDVPERDFTRRLGQILRST